MADIIIHKNGRPGGRAVVIPCTAKGVTFIRGQITGGSTQYSIDSEHVNDYVDALEKEGLEIEIK